MSVEACKDPAARDGAIRRTVEQHLLAVVDDTCRRLMNQQLAVREFATASPAGSATAAGTIRRAYHEGQEDQLAAVWHPRYLDAAVTRLRAPRGTTSRTRARPALPAQGPAYQLPGPPHARVAQA
ncbi:hypothetical protein OOK13_28030 [Streptomyces sp. NBC_00378]|uniref:hypothetical protein n=1 Tax=Streptomyces sp. NBC_00378 TaxID=2975732 RepID=UPI0022591686|nr:hypothetical protein [Streptomyces sp. NBC_00378]MCX5112306.1 hypothetical protein [Streptomyces sp. NBC_00378]